MPSKVDLLDYERVTLVATMTLTSGVPAAPMEVEVALTAKTSVPTTELVNVAICVAPEPPLYLPTELFDNVIVGPLAPPFDWKMMIFPTKFFKSVSLKVIAVAEANVLISLKLLKVPAAMVPLRGAKVTGTWPSTG